MRVAFNASVMDLLHRGHSELLELMRQKADKVIVILHDDKSVYEIKGKFPVQTLEHRVRNVQLTGLVDEIMTTYATDPAYEFEQVIRKYKNPTYFRGDDKTEDFPGKWMLAKYNIPIEFKPYTTGVSSTKLRDEL